MSDSYEFIGGSYASSHHRAIIKKSPWIVIYVQKEAGTKPQEIISSPENFTDSKIFWALYLNI